MVVNALEDARLRQQDMYMLFVDFTPAFNTASCGECWSREGDYWEIAGGMLGCCGGCFVGAEGATWLLQGGWWGPRGGAVRVRRGQLGVAMGVLR
jgi:hypothetical protein